jgi:hypothetical protein
VLVELGLLEQRYQTALAVLNEGATVTEVASFGVTRQSVHRWLRHDAARGWSGWSISRAPQLVSESDHANDRKVLLHRALEK